MDQQDQTNLSVDSPPPSGDTSGDATGVPAAGSPRHSRRTLVVGSVVLLALLALIVGVASTAGGPAVPGAGMTPTAFVISATHTTLAHRTADLAISGSVSTSGETVTLLGTGQTDLTSGSTVADMTAYGPGTSLVERELASGGHLYMGLTVDGTSIAAITGGRHWIELPVSVGGSTAASLGSGAVDPLTQLQLLTTRGNTVRPLGLSDIEGTTTSGYAIIPSRQTIDQAVQKEIAAAHLSAADAQQVRGEASSFSSFAIDVWFDASGILRRMSVDLHTTAATSAQVVMTFENYGTPVTVSPPALSDVMSYSSFMAALRSVESTSHS